MGIKRVHFARGLSLMSAKQLIKMNHLITVKGYIRRLEESTPEVLHSSPNVIHLKTYINSQGMRENRGNS